MPTKKAAAGKRAKAGRAPAGRLAAPSPKVAAPSPALAPEGAAPLVDSGLKSAAETAPGPVGPLQLGAATVLDPRTGELLGYAFVEASGAGQLQRWILYRNPQNSFTITDPPPEMVGWTLEKWQANVPSLWRPGSYYIRAQADLYAFGGTYALKGGDRTVWDRLPADWQLPDPTYPPGGVDFQMWYRDLLITVQSEDGRTMGSVFANSTLDDNLSAEWWLLSPGYAPAGAAARTTVSEGTQNVSTRSDFIGRASSSWAPGAVLAITGCKNFHDAGNKGALPQIL